MPYATIEKKKMNICVNIMQPIKKLYGKVVLNVLRNGIKTTRNTDHYIVITNIIKYKLMTRFQPFLEKYFYNAFKN